jgi:GrpB-like predicted nucleotidyltransferase (UPF0157 family)
VITLGENHDNAEKKQVRVIEVVPYDPKWKDDYLKESEIIKGIMKDEIIETYHIGSTSIPGIAAKPVIDILVEVGDINNIDSYNRDMEKLGYIAKGEYGIQGRRFFMKGLYNRTHHVHIFQTGNPEISRHINFRDYMIQHSDEARKYGDLKKELAVKFRYDIDGYCKGKDAFIKDIDRKVRELKER